MPPKGAKKKNPPIKRGRRSSSSSSTSSSSTATSSSTSSSSSSNSSSSASSSSLSEKTAAGRGRGRPAGAETQRKKKLRETVTAALSAAAATSRSCVEKPKAASYDCFASIDQLVLHYPNLKIVDPPYSDEVPKAMRSEPRIYLCTSCREQGVPPQRCFRTSLNKARIRSHMLHKHPSHKQPRQSSIETTQQRASQQSAHEPSPFDAHLGSQLGDDVFKARLPCAILRSHMSLLGATTFLRLISPYLSARPLPLPARAYPSEPPDDAAKKALTKYFSRADEHLKELLSTCDIFGLCFDGGQLLGSHVVFITVVCGAGIFADRKSVV